MQTKRLIYQAKKKLLGVWQLFWLEKHKFVKSRNKKARIGFLVQMSEIWDSESGLYEEFRSRSDCEVIMLVVPPYDFANSYVKTNYQDNYFLNNYPEAVKALDENGKVINMNALKLDYLFYQRPYDHYLPIKLRSYMMIRYAKICYVPYCYNLTSNADYLLTSSYFVTGLYFYFSECERIQTQVTAQFQKRIQSGLQHFEYLGYPAFEPYLKMREDSAKPVETILWTPRWSYDRVVGGSHFFEYKDSILSIQEKHPNIKCVFRPHQMMFDEFVKKGLMTDDEVQIFLNRLRDLGIEYDVEFPLQESFQKTDLLISDISSVVVMFFLTGKPLIYCDRDFELVGFAKKMKECMYVANNQEELDYYLDEILKGNDWLRKKRMALIQNEFPDAGYMISKIVIRILEDFNT